MNRPQMPRPYNVTSGLALTLWYQAGFRHPPKFVAMRMTRPRSVKYTSALVRVLPDFAPTCVKTTAGKGQTEETRPRVSRIRVGSSREAMSRPKRRPSGERTTRLTIRWATERPRGTAGTDMARWAPFVSIEREIVSVEMGTSALMAVAAMTRAPPRSCSSLAGSLAREPMHW